MLNDYNGRDWFLPLAYGNAAQTRSVSLELVDFDANVFDSDALPTQAPTLSAFEVARLNFATPSFGLTGTLDSLSCTLGCAPPLPVPEPATWALLLAGVGMVGWMQRRRPQRA